MGFYVMMFLLVVGIVLVAWGLKRRKTNSLSNLAGLAGIGFVIFAAYLAMP